MPKIDLHNFFKHYDENNPKHVAAVEELEKDAKWKSACNEFRRYSKLGENL
jgi:hypothetical protein